ncbi:MAG: hypothetical protein JKY99_01800, partial [Rhizobiales bacterium]|nr:hypothetical protein [Hyphomicrobiales bacterium]
VVEKLDKNGVIETVHLAKFIAHGFTCGFRKKEQRRITGQPRHQKNQNEQTEQSKQGEENSSK